MSINKIKAKHKLLVKVNILTQNQQIIILFTNYKIDFIRMIQIILKVNKMVI